MPNLPFLLGPLSRWTW